MSKEDRDANSAGKAGIIAKWTLTAVQYGNEIALKYEPLDLHRYGRAPAPDGRGAQD